MFATVDVETVRRKRFGKYRSSAPREPLLTDLALESIDQTDALARELEIELAQFAKEIKAGH